MCHVHSSGVFIEADFKTCGGQKDLYPVDIGKGIFRLCENGYLSGIQFLKDTEDGIAQNPEIIQSYEDFQIVVQSGNKRSFGVNVELQLECADMAVGRSLGA